MGTAEQGFRGRPLRTLPGSLVPSGLQPGLFSFSVASCGDFGPLGLAPVISVKFTESSGLCGKLCLNPVSRRFCLWGSCQEAEKIHSPPQQDQCEGLNRVSQNRV